MKTLRILTLLFVAAVSFVLPSCGNDEPDLGYSLLLGTWRSASPADGVNFIYLLDFRKDGTFTEVDIRQSGTSTGDVATPGTGDSMAPGTSAGDANLGDYKVYSGTWTVVGKEILLMGGGVATSTSTSVDLSSTALVVIATDGSHIFTRVPKSAIEPYL